MKKLFFCLFLLLFCTSLSFADEMTKSQQAIAFYNDNNIEGAIKILQSIPENDKTAEDWLLMGNLLRIKTKKQKQYSCLNEQF